MAESIEIFEGVTITERNGIWQFQMWLSEEKKMVRESLKTRYQREAMRLAQKKWADITTAKDSGKSYFSMTAAQGVQAYLDYKRRELGTAIKEGRLGTIKTHLKHWQEYIGAGTKFKDMHLDSCAGYFEFRNEKKQKSHTTLVNETPTINAMMTYLFKRSEIRFPAFEFPKLNKYELDTEAIRRQTLTIDEFNRLVETMRAYVQPKRHELPEREHYVRQMMRFYVLIDASCGLRTGELQQLRWKNVSLTMERPDRAQKVSIGVQKGPPIGAQKGPPV